MATKQQKGFLDGWMSPASLAHKLNRDERRKVMMAMLQIEGGHIDLGYAAERTQRSTYLSTVVNLLLDIKDPAGTPLPFRSETKLYAGLLIRALVEQYADDVPWPKEDLAECWGIDFTRIEAEPEDVPRKKKIKRIRIEDDDEDDDDGDYPVTNTRPKVRA